MAVVTPEMPINPETQTQLQARLPGQEEKELNQSVNSLISEAQQGRLDLALKGQEQPHESTPAANTDPNVGDNLGDFIERTGLIPGGPPPRPGSESANTLIALEHEKEAKILNKDFSEKKKGWFKLPWR